MTDDQGTGNYRRDDEDTGDGAGHDPGTDAERTGVPARGEAVEIPGEGPAVEYEEVRAAPPWLTPLVVAVVSLFAVFVVTRATIFDDGGDIALSARPSGPVPEALADGSALPELPEELVDRFAAPVIGTRELETVPEAITEQCRTPFDETRIDEAAVERIADVVQGGGLADLRVTPEVVSVLRTGRAESPPGWPDTWALSCLGRYTEEGTWTARPPRLGFARDGGDGAADAEAGAGARLTLVPEGAAWAVQERDGWWLAAPVEGGTWAQVVVDGGRGDEVRVVFLDDDGDLVEDRILTRQETAPDEATEGTEAQITAGQVSEVLEAAEEEPLRRCTDDDVCVWITRTGSELQAHAAWGSHPLDVPPFGSLGWCPPAGRLQGTVTRSQFGQDGDWEAGVAPTGVTGYPLRFADGEVVVDLSQPRPGTPAGPEPNAFAVCTFGGDPIGERPSEPIEPL